MNKSLEEALNTGMLYTWTNSDEASMEDQSTLLEIIRQLLEDGCSGLRDADYVFMQRRIMQKMKEEKR